MHEQMATVRHKHEWKAATNDALLTISALSTKHMHCQLVGDIGDLIVLAQGFEATRKRRMRGVRSAAISVRALELPTTDKVLDLLLRGSVSTMVRVFTEKIGLTSRATKLHGRRAPDLWHQLCGVHEGIPHQEEGVDTYETN